MTTLFDRVARITVENENGIRRELADLHCDFRIEKTQNSKPNSMTLKVWNLSQDSVNLIRGNKDGKSKIEVNAGYAGDVSLIYKGDVITNGVTVSRQKTDKICEIRCGDGLQAMKDERVSLSYNSGISVRRVIDDVIKQTGLDLGEIKGLDTITGSFQNGFADVGPIRNVMDRIAKAAGVEWSVQNGAVQVLTKDQVRDETAFVINKDTGMLGAPSMTKNGVKLVTLMLPKINIGRQIVLESDRLNGSHKGVYKVTKVTHEGDNRRGAWQSQLECLEV